MNRLASETFDERPVVNSLNALVIYLQINMAHLDREELRVLFLTPHARLIKDEVVAVGNCCSVEVEPARIFKRAFELGSVKLIIAHNHPSGFAQPSAMDIDFTRKIVETGRTLGILIIDHLIIARNEWSSFNQIGIL